MVMDVIKVQYKDYDVGALSFDEEQGLGAFQYTESFIKTGIQLAPLMMPLSDEIYIFPELNPKNLQRSTRNEPLQTLYLMILVIIY